MKPKQKKKLDKLALKAALAVANYKARLDHINRKNQNKRKDKGGFFQMTDGLTVAFFENKDSGDALIDSYEEINIK